MRGFHKDLATVAILSLSPGILPAALFGKEPRRKVGRGGAYLGECPAMNAHGLSSHSDSSVEI